MRIQLRRFAPNAVAFFVASAFLAGCSAANVTPSQGVAANSNWAAPGVAHRVTEPDIIRNREILESTSGRGGEGGCDSRPPTWVFVSGKARGPYPGKFSGCGAFSINRSFASFGGSFTITSGANTITGSFSGMGQGGCGRGGCGASGKMTYTATLEPGGKILSGKGHALMSVSGTGGRMDLFLQRFM